MTGLTKFLGSLASGDRSFRKIAFRDDVKGLTIDTVNTFDCGWETGIKKNGEWIIVEEYSDEQRAKKGHKKWIKSIKENPIQELEHCRTAMEWAFGY